MGPPEGHQGTMQRLRGQHIIMSTLAGSSHKDSMHDPLVWIEISALTDPHLPHLKNGWTIAQLFPLNKLLSACSLGSGPLWKP